MSIGKDSLLS